MPGGHLYANVRQLPISTLAMRPKTSPNDENLLSRADGVFAARTV
ncbi:hypothetical protein J2Z50_006625 [Ensifer mexicanus]|nr:hypothetical protein [Sinorhizobium mexicanum]